MSYEVREYEKINLLPHKGSSNSYNLNISSFFFISLISFNFWRKWKNYSRFKIILTSIAFLVCILYKFSKPQNRLKSRFTCQFFTPDTIEITNEVNTHISGVKWAFLLELNLDSKTIIYFILCYSYFRVM